MLAGPQRVQVKPRSELDRNAIAGNMPPLTHGQQSDTSGNVPVLILLSLIFFKALGGSVLAHHQSKSIHYFRSSVVFCSFVFFCNPSKHLRG